MCLFIHSFTHLFVINVGDKIITNVKLPLPNGGELNKQLKHLVIRAMSGVLTRHNGIVRRVFAQCSSNPTSLQYLTRFTLPLERYLLSFSFPAISVILYNSGTPFISLMTPSLSSCCIISSHFQNKNVPLRMEEISEGESIAREETTQFLSRLSLPLGLYLQCVHIYIYSCTLP